MSSSVRFAAACGLVVSGAFCAWTSPLLALGGTYQIDAQGHIVAEQPDWPAGLAGLINSGPVFHGHWVNAASEFFYLGDTASLNRFLEGYARLEHTPLDVVLHAGVGRRSALWGEKPIAPYDWSVLVRKRGWGAPQDPDHMEDEWTARIDVWLDGNIRLPDLIVPANVRVASGGEIEAFIDKHAQTGAAEADHQADEARRARTREACARYRALSGIAPGTSVRTVEQALALPEPFEYRAPATIDPVWRFRYRCDGYWVGFAAQRTGGESPMRSEDLDTRRFQYVGDLWITESIGPDADVRPVPEEVLRAAEEAEREQEHADQKDE